MWNKNPNPPADALQGAITHDFQTEGYYIISGSGTAFIDGKLLNGRQSTNNPDGGPNGPGCGGGVAVGSRKVELKVGDVLIVPPGVIHGWFDIADHVDYLSFRPSHGIMKPGGSTPPSRRVARSAFDSRDRVCERPSRSVPSTLGPPSSHLFRERIPTRWASRATAGRAAGSPKGVGY